MDESATAGITGMPEPRDPAANLYTDPAAPVLAPANAREVAGDAEWIALCRPRTWVLTGAPVVVALTLVWAHGAKLLPMPAVLALAAAVIAHAGANMLDAYLEAERGRRTTWLEGTVDHRLPHDRLGSHRLRVLRVSFLLLAVGACIGLPLIEFGGWPVAALGAGGLLVAFLYSSTRYALKRLPLGELLLFLALGPGLVATTVLAQRQHVTPDELLIGCALGLFATALLELPRVRMAWQAATPDHSAVLTLRRWLFALCLVGAYALVTVAALTQVPAQGAAAVLLSLPTALVVLTGGVRAQGTLVLGLAARQTLRAYTLFAALVVAGVVLVPVAIRVWLSF